MVVCQRCYDMDELTITMVHQYATLDDPSTNTPIAQMLKCPRCGLERAAHGGGFFA